MINLADASLEVHIRESVERGAEFLDEIKPDWYTFIDIESLNMSSGHYCICGQLFVDRIFNEYGEQCYESGYEWAVSELIDGNDVSYGFATFGSMHGGEGKAWEFLALEWIVQIEKRLAEDGDML